MARKPNKPATAAAPPVLVPVKMLVGLTPVAGDAVHPGAIYQCKPAFAARLIARGMAVPVDASAPEFALGGPAETR